MDNDRVIRMHEVSQLVGLSVSTIYDRMNENSRRYDPTFPKSFGYDDEGNGRAKGFSFNAVQAWIKRRAELGKTPRAKVGRKRTQATEKMLPSRVQEKVAKPLAIQHQAAHVVALGETITNGNAINATLQRYLTWPEWTPAVGCLLIAGIAPSESCSSIPSESGVGLDGKTLRAGDKRFRAAREFFSEWLEQEVDPPDSELPDSLEPAAFLQWCCDYEVQSVWLELFLDVMGVPGGHADSVTSSRLALLISGKGLAR